MSLTVAQVPRLHLRQAAAERVQALVLGAALVARLARVARAPPAAHEVVDVGARVA